MRSRTSLRVALLAALALTATGTAVTGPASAATAGCQATYQVTSQWSGGFGASVQVSNLGDAVTSWHVTWSFPAGQTVSQLWNGTYSQTGAQVSVSNVGWNGSVPTGGSVSFGFNGTWNNAGNPPPVDFALNGVACGAPGTSPTSAAPTSAAPTSAAPTSATPSASPVGTPVTVAVSAASSGQVGAGFAGFSDEKDRVGAGMFDARDTNLVNLFRLLGPSVLRIGGNLVDMVNWNPGGSGGSATEIAPADVTKLAAFAQATGWKVLYGINLKTNTAANAAAEAAFASNALGSSLLAFEIGNEPNYYRTEATYETSYNSYVAAIRAKVPGAVFDGPGVASDNAWLTPFATHERNNSLALLSMHTYIGNNTSASVSGMLASTAAGGTLAGQWSALAAAKAAGGIAQWRMTEANSYFHGGADGVSNVQAAALWALEFMHGIAANDGAGVNFHGGTSTQFPLHYSPIVFSGLTPTGVQAVYYAELLWSLAGTGALHAASVSGATGVTAWGIGPNVIVNNERSGAVTATVRLATSASRANGYLLTAPSLTSKAITLAGSDVSANATFHPAPQPLALSGTTVTVTVPSGSALLVTTG